MISAQDEYATLRDEIVATQGQALYIFLGTFMLVGALLGILQRTQQPLSQVELSFIFSALIMTLTMSSWLVESLHRNVMRIGTYIMTVLESPGRGWENATYSLRLNVLKEREPIIPLQPRTWLRLRPTRWFDFGKRAAMLFAYALGALFIGAYFVADTWTGRDAYSAIRPFLMQDMRFLVVLSLLAHLLILLIVWRDSACARQDRQRSAWEKVLAEARHGSERKPHYYRTSSPPTMSHRSALHKRRFGIPHDSRF